MGVQIEPESDMVKSPQNNHIKEFSQWLHYMKKKVKFTSKMTVSNIVGNLSSDSGLILVKEFMDSLNFSDVSKKYLEIEDEQLYHTHNNLSLME